MKRILIIGATSAIAEACASLWAAGGASFYLIARDGSRLAMLAADLKIRGAQSVHTADFEAASFGSHQALIARAFEVVGEFDIILIAHGSLGDQKACEADASTSLREFETNATSTISLLTWAANAMEQQGWGTLAVLSSVAGDRGRQSNYVYGSAKAAVSIFVQGLRNRLHFSGVNVMTIKPGMVDTPMTKNLPKGLLFSSPEAVAKVINKTIESRRAVVYAPQYWWAIMTVIKMVPETIFKRMKL